MVIQILSTLLDNELHIQKGETGLNIVTNMVDNKPNEVLLTTLRKVKPDPVLFSLTIWIQIEV
jgi:hypothetical protein